MKIVSFDASTTCTGWASIIDGTLDDYGIIDLKKNKDTPSRLHDMCYEILDLLEKHSPDVIYIEDAWQGNNPKTMKLLMHIIGAVYGWCVKQNKKIIEIIPSSWRKILGWEIGKKSRDELKIMSMKYVADTYNVITTCDDLSDAICIATAGAIEEKEK